MGIECDRALELLLGADPVDLEGSGSGELADHLGECGRCREVAKRLLEGQAALGRALDRMAPGIGAEEALVRARATGRRRSRRAKAWGLSVPLAAAAVLAGLLIARGPRVEDTMRGRAQSLPVIRMEPLVEAPVDRNVMVFETSDRSAKVIWFY